MPVVARPNRGTGFALGVCFCTRRRREFSMKPPPGRVGSPLGLLTANRWGLQTGLRSEDRGQVFEMRGGVALHLRNAAAELLEIDAFVRLRPADAVCFREPAEGARQIGVVDRSEER